MDTTQKTPNRGFAENSHKSLIGEVEAWNTWEVEAEIVQSSADLAAARILEAAGFRNSSRRESHHYPMARPGWAAAEACTLLDAILEIPFTS